MAHFAHITNGIVDSVIVIERDVLERAGGWYVNGELRPVGEWVQTSYNTSKGDYKFGSTEQEKLSLKSIGSTEDVKARNRKNYAGIGYTYDRVNDRFIPPQKFPSWTLDEKTCTWIAPKKMPIDGQRYSWDEQLLDWVILN